jgi:hypothetical protein
MKTIKTIYKYELQITDEQGINMPIGAEILTAQMQGENLQLWALVDPDRDIKKRFFEVIGTGHDVTCFSNTERKYISTVQLSGGKLIFHVFERINLF